MAPASADLQGVFMIRFAAASLAASLFLVVAAPASSDAVDDYVRASLEANKIPGVSIVVRRDGKVVKSQGYGFANLEHQVPATADTIYQSGSMGKQFTAAGILLLVEDGKLSLDDRLAKFFPDGPSSWHRITIRQLLTHTSGIKDYSDEYDMRKDYTEDEQLDIATKIPLDFEPGTQWSYSNTGYLILGVLTSKLADKHWSEFQAERIFKPLGMTTARMISEADIIPHRAAGYDADDKGEPKNQSWVSPQTNTTGDGALYFSVKDLAAWDAALDAQKFMTAEHFKEWWTPVSLANGTTYPYGFGWGIQEQRGHAMIEHGGAWQGFRTGIARYPEQRLSVSVLANSSEADAMLIARTIAGLVEPALRMPDADAKLPDPDPARTQRLRGVLDAYAGYRPVPEMAKALAETAAGSAREAYGRKRIGEALAEAQSFQYIGEDDLSQKPVAIYGEQVTRLVYYAVRTKDERSVLKFRLNDKGQVLDFERDEL
jgi:CubicO group peptidase (beta-lactamase class C family)